MSNYFQKIERGNVYSITNYEPMVLKKTTNSADVSLFLNKHTAPFEKVSFGVNIDGKIGNFKQGNVGDCQLLAMILGLKFTKWGQEAFDKAVDSDGKGGAFVTLYGGGFHSQAIPNKKVYHITNEEILEAKKGESLASYPFISMANYSTGDDDVTAVELAVEKAVLEDDPKLTKRALESFLVTCDGVGHGALAGDGAKFESGLSCFVSSLLSARKSNLNFLEANWDNKRMTALVSFGKDFRSYCNVLDSKKANGESKAVIKEECFIDNHAYAIKGFKTDSSGLKLVSLVNPHDTSKELQIPYTTLLKNSILIRISASEDIKNELAEYFNKELKFSEEIDFSELVKNEQIVLKDAYRKQQYEIFRQNFLTASSQDREKVINDYFSSLVSSESSVDEKRDFIVQFRNNIEELITSLYKNESGWGKSAAKKASVEPIVNKLCNAILSFDKQDINSEEFKRRQFYKYYENCINELDAIFYTDENKIIENLKKLTFVYENVLKRFSEEKI